MNKNKSENFKWLVEIFDVNGQKFEKYDVLAYKEEEIKKMKKRCKTKDEFNEAFRLRMMSRYWSRAEWEFIIKKIADRIVLIPWCGGRDGVKFDITDDTSFDWRGFAEKHISAPHIGSENEAKVDVYDQLQYRWSEFLDFVWNFHHKYQRKKNVVNK